MAHRKKRLIIFNSIEKSRKARLCISQRKYCLKTCKLRQKWSIAILQNSITTQWALPVALINVMVSFSVVFFSFFLFCGVWTLKKYLSSSWEKNYAKINPPIFTLPWSQTFKWLVVRTSRKNLFDSSVVLLLRYF